MPPYVLITNDEGRVIDHFRLDRYSRDRIGVSILAEDILLANLDNRQPGDYQILPNLAFDLLQALQGAIDELDDPVKRRQPTVRRLHNAFRQVRMLHTFAALPPDDQRRRLIDEMAYTARLTEYIENLAELAESALTVIQERSLSDPEFDALRDFLQQDIPDADQTPKTEHLNHLAGVSDRRGGTRPVSPSRLPIAADR